MHPQQQGFDACDMVVRDSRSPIAHPDAPHPSTQHVKTGVNAGNQTPLICKQPHHWETSSCSHN